MCNFLIENLYLNEKEFSCEQVLQEFHVETEADLENLLIKESKTIPCIKCGREFPIEELDFNSGDPICKNCENIIV